MVGCRWGGPDFGGARLSKDRIGLARVPVHNLPIVGDVCERAEPWPWRTTARRAFWRSYVFQRRNTDLLREIPGSFGSLAPPTLLPPSPRNSTELAETPLLPPVQNPFFVLTLCVFASLREISLRLDLWYGEVLRFTFLDLSRLSGARSRCDSSATAWQ